MSVMVNGSKLICWKSIQGYIYILGPAKKDPPSPSGQILEYTETMDNVDVDDDDHVDDDNDKGNYNNGSDDDDDDHEMNGARPKHIL